MNPNAERRNGQSGRFIEEDRADGMNPRGGLIVGLEWWGVGPNAMSQALTRAGMHADPVVIWDIRKKSHRIAMLRPLEVPVSSLRVRFQVAQQLLENGLQQVDWIAVTAPHRLSLRDLALLRNRTGTLVALIGDRPIGQRLISEPKIRMFDAIGLPDPTWLEDLPCQPRHSVSSVWGSVLPVPEPEDTKPYEPRGLAVVGTPYPDRVKLVHNLEEAGHVVEAVGSQWLGKLKGTVHESMPIPKTIANLRSRRLAALNIHHPQFTEGLNPQFSDYAVNNIPQVVLSGRGAATGHSLGRSAPAGISSLLVRTVNLTELSDGARVLAIGELARAHLKFEDTMGRLLP